MRERNEILLRVSDLVRGMHACPNRDAKGMFDLLVHDAVRFVPAARYAGLTLFDRMHSVEYLAYNHNYALVLDHITCRHREGPGLSAVSEHKPMQIDDLSAERRWPRFQRDAVAATPIRSILSLPLVTEPKSLSCLNLYADADQVFDDDSVELGLVFASQTALAWSIARRNGQFRSALASRDIIGQAKGMVMERFNIDAGHAFNLLKKLSQSSNEPVAEIARRLVQIDHPPI